MLEGKGKGRMSMCKVESLVEVWGLDDKGDIRGGFKMSWVSYRCFLVV